MKVLYTIGHGTLAADELSSNLTRHGIQCVVDVRSTPFSQRAPHFNQRPLERMLKKAGIDYVWAETLGGRPPQHLRTETGAPNYEAMSQEEATRRALDDLAEASDVRKIAILCSESRPEECHRTRMLEPELERRGCAINHILKDGSLASLPTLFA